jgi:glycine cleavage system H lipoate-binding protein/ABC-type phosphate transport system substrate-binding protein
LNNLFHQQNKIEEIMKTRIFLIIGMLLLSYSISFSKAAVNGGKTSQAGSINVLTSPDLYNLTTKWASEYCRLNPTLQINVIKSSENNLAGMLNPGAGIGFVSDESYASLNNQSTWSMVVGRDVIVPVMNAKNPFLDEIYRKGITSERLARMFENPEKSNWGMLLRNGQNIPVHFYIMDDASIKSGVAHFLKTNQSKIDGIKTLNKQEMISAIQKDPNALGFCKLIDIIDLSNQSLAENIKLVPIDKNGNGKIDYMEDIYDNLQAFSRGIWIGKYPKALSGHIYSVSSVKPKNETEVAFLKWVLTDGQRFLSTNGYSDLVYSERQTQLDKINDTVIYTAAPTKDTYAILKVVILIVVAFGLIGFFVDLVVRRIRNKKGIVPNAASAFAGVFDENSVIVPKGLYFDKTHTWAFMEKDGSVKIGIDDFLQHITGPLSRIGMKPAGVKIKKGDPLLTIIQKGKHLIIYSPVSGIITEYNKTLITDSSALNAAPYADGWVYTIEPTNWLREIQFLSMAENYKTWLKEEFLRLKDFFASAIMANTPEYAHIALQDGGALKDSILADLGPEVWEDFQTKFIDTAK